MPSMNHSGSAERTAMLVGDIELERVDDLVTEHVVGFAEARRERQDDAAFAGVGEAAGALVDQAAVNVGLLEPAVAAIAARAAGARAACDRRPPVSRACQRSAMRPAICAAAASSSE